MSQAKIETWVGTLVLVFALLFFAFAYRSTSVLDFGGTYRLIAKFDRVDGVNTGTDVRVAGIKVGSVVAATLDAEDFLAVVELSLDNDYDVPDDSVAQITSQGLLGVTYVAIEPGGSDVLLEDGEEIQFTQGAPNLVDLISSTVFGQDDSK